MPNATLNPHDLRRAAVAAGCDPRTIRSFLEGRPTRSTTAARIAEALHSLGFEVAPPTRETAQGLASD